MVNGDRLPVWDDEKILEKDGGDGYPTVGMCLMPLSCGLKKLVKVVNFMLCIFCPSLKKHACMDWKEGI